MSGNITPIDLDILLTFIVKNMSKGFIIHAGIASHLNIKNCSI